MSHAMCHMLQALRLLMVNQFLSAPFLRNLFLDPEAFEKAWQPGCKILLLNFPTNPTGGTADKAKASKTRKICGGKRSYCHK